MHPSSCALPTPHQCALCTPHRLFCTSFDDARCLIAAVTASSFLTAVPTRTAARPAHPAGTGSATNSSSAGTVAAVPSQSTAASGTNIGTNIGSHIGTDAGTVAAVHPQSTAADLLASLMISLVGASAAVLMCLAGPDRASGAPPTTGADGGGRTD